MYYVRKTKGKTKLTFTGFSKLEIKNIGSLKKHSSWVCDISWCPNKKILASGSLDNTIKVWDVNKYILLHVLKGHYSGVISVGWSPCGKYLASGDINKTIIIWNTRTWKHVKILTNHSDSVCSISWHPNKELFASGSDDTSIRIWEMSKNKPLRVLRDNAGLIKSVKWSLCGEYLASGSKNGTITIWKTNPWKCIKKLKKHSDSVLDICWSSNKNYLVSGGADKTIIIWNIKTWKVMRILKEHSCWIESISCNPSVGDIMASSSGDNTVKIWDVKKGKLINSFNKHSSTVESVRWSSCGKYLASGDHDGVIEIQQIFRELNPQEKHQFLARIKNYNLASLLYTGRCLSIYPQRITSAYRLSEIKKNDFYKLLSPLNTLNTNSWIMFLDVSGTKIHSKDFTSLCEQLKTNKNIISANLSNTNIGDYNTANQLANALKVNTTLKHLDLSKNEFTDITVSYLFKSLKQNPKKPLIQLNLSHNHIYCGKHVVEKHFKLKQKNLKINLAGNALLRNSKEFIEKSAIFYNSAITKLNSTFSSKYIITHEKWIVAIGAKNTLTGSHAFGLVEGIRKDNQRFLFRCDLTADGMLKGNAKIITTSCNPFDDKYAIEKNQNYIFRIFNKVDKLKANIFKTKMLALEGKDEKIFFSILGYSTKNTFNCTKVLVDKIIECDIPTEAEKKELQSWVVQNIPRSGAGGSWCSVM